MALSNSPIAPGAELSADAEYPTNLTSSGYGGSAALESDPDEVEEDEYDEEELTITDDDDDIDAVEEDDEDDI